MGNNDLALIIEEAEGWIGRLKTLKARHDVPPVGNVRTGGRQLGKSWLRQTTDMPCPNHGSSYCVQCSWPPRYRGVTFDRAILDELVIEHPTDTQAIDAAFRDAVLTGHGRFMAEHRGDEIKIEHLPPLGYPLAPMPPRTMSQEELRKLYEQEAPQAEQSTGYTAVDMATAAAEGFRDGVASVVVQMPSLETLGEYSQEAGRWVLDACQEAIEDAGGTVVRL